MTHAEDTGSIQIVRVHQHDGDLKGLSVAPELEYHRVADLKRIFDVADLIGGGDGLEVDLGDNVADLDALLCRVGVFLNA